MENDKHAEAGRNGNSMDALLSPRALKKALKYGVIGYFIGCIPLVPDMLWIPAAILGLLKGEEEEGARSDRDDD